MEVGAHHPQICPIPYVFPHTCTCNLMNQAFPSTKHPRINVATIGSTKTLILA